MQCHFYVLAGRSIASNEANGCHFLQKLMKKLEIHVMITVQFKKKHFVHNAAPLKSFSLISILALKFLLYCQWQQCVACNVTETFTKFNCFFICFYTVMVTDSFSASLRSDFECNSDAQKRQNTQETTLLR